MDIMNLNNMFLTIAQGNLLQSQDQVILRNMVHLSLLKCGHVEMESMIDQGNLSPGIHWKKLILFVKNLFSAKMRIPQGTKRRFTMDQDSLIIPTPKKWQIPKISSATMNAATFMGQNFLDNENTIMNSGDLTLKHMFDISEKLVSEQEEINNVDKIYWKNHFMETAVIDW